MHTYIVYIMHVHGAHARDRALCVSMHVSIMFTMVTSPEGCPVEEGDRIREGQIR